MNPTGTVVTEDEYCADTKEAHGTGSLTDFWSETNHGLHIGSLDLPILILITFPSMLVRQKVSFIHSHLQIRRGSSAYRFSKVHIVRNALQRGSSIALNSRGSVLSFGKNSHYHSKFLSRVATSAHSASGISRMSCMRFTCQSQAGDEPTRWHIWLRNRYIFPDGWRLCVVSCRHGIVHIPVVP